MSYLHKRLQPFKYPAFCWYLLSCVLTTVGAGLSYIAMTWMAVSINHSVISTAILMLAFWAPGTMLGPFMGVVVDRLPYRQYLLVFSNWTRALVLVLAAVLLRYVDSVAVLAVTNLFLGFFFSIYMPAAFRLTREIVPPEILLHANAAIDMTFELGSLVGMALAGLLIALTSGPDTLIINGVMFVLSGIALLMIRKHHLLFQAEQRTSIKIVKDFLEGVRYILSSKSICLIYTIQLLFFLEYLTAPVLLAPFAHNVLHANVSEFGYIETGLSAGAFVGGLFLVWFVDKFSMLAVLYIVGIILGLSYVFFCYNHSIGLATGLYFVMGFCFAMWPIIVTHAQHITSIDFQGRVQSCFNSVSSMLLIILFLLVMLTGHFVAIRFFYWIEVVFSLLILLLTVVYDRTQRHAHQGDLKKSTGGN